MIELEFIISIIIVVVTAVSLAITFMLYHISTKPALSIEGPSINCRSKKNTLTYGIDLMYVPGNMSCKTKHEIDTIHVKFTVHNQSQHVLRNIELRYNYSNIQITKKCLLKHSVAKKISLAPNTSMKISREHDTTFTDYDVKSHYFAVLVSAKHHFSSTKVFSVLHACQGHTTPTIDYE